MRRRSRWTWPAVLLLGFGAMWVLRSCATTRTAPMTEGPSITLTPTDRLLVLAPHPDDEVLCCGGLIQQAVAMGLPIRIVFFTYGDNNQWSFLLYHKRPVLLPWSVRRMGEIRHDEAIAAAKVLGLVPEHLTFLGYPDFGTLHIWHDHWGDRQPFASMLTHVHVVPYPDALRPGAPYKGEEVVRDLSTVLRTFRPTKVFVSHPGDHMPDHQALALFTQIALWDLGTEVGHPDVYPYLIHFPQWPKPRGYAPATHLGPPAKFREGMMWRSFLLTPPQLERKHNAIQAHRTQYGYSARYLLSFMRPNELFGLVPPIPLGHRHAARPVQVDHEADAQPPPEELTDVERAAFVGLETRSIQLDGHELVLSIAFSRPLAKAVEASVDVFGYRRDRLFAQMPKLHVRIGAFTHALYDQGRRLPADGVRVKRRSKQLMIRVPLALLGDPEYVLTGARTLLGEVPLDWSSWRVLDLTADGSDS